MASALEREEAPALRGKHNCRSGYSLSSHQSEGALRMRQSEASAKKVIWIDMDNTPHVPFFAPLIKELSARGYSITLTARDAYQTCELADFFKLDYRRVGKHYGRHRIMKVAGTCIRALQLVRLIHKLRPSLAVAHSSRSLTIASALLGIPCLQIIDYEWIASAGLARPTWVMMPDVITTSGFEADTVLKYPGIKEDVYVPQFVPDSSIKAELRLEENDLVVTVRPPATEAHYHNPASDQLFDAVIELMALTTAAKVILLPRNAGQEKGLRQRRPDLFKAGKLIIPEHAVDGLNLIWFSDLVISAGGTMNREAAALGVPVYSIFRGKIGAVDRYLADTGRLVLLESIEDVRRKIKLTRRERPATPCTEHHRTLDTIVENIVSIVESKHPV